MHKTELEKYFLFCLNYEAIKDIGERLRDPDEFIDVNAMILTGIWSHNLKAV